MKRFFLAAILTLSIFSVKASAQNTESLRREIQKIVSDKDAVVGVSIAGSDERDTVSLLGNNRLPMQSVFKFHIALAVLSQVDKGIFSLDSMIRIGKDELLPGLYSPIREQYPDGASLKLSEIIEYTVSLSDNVGCDLLLRLIGGPGAVEKYFADNNIKDVSIKLNEEEQQSAWDLQFQNWTTPNAANETLKAFYYNKGDLLSGESHEYIWKVMKETRTGVNRIKGRLPEGTVVAHKTGTSATNAEGLTAAINDIGIVFLPDGKHFFISVFVTSSKENAETNEMIIAGIAKAAWDHFTAGTN